MNIEDGDRRYFVFNSKAQPRENDYYERLDSVHEYHASLPRVESRAS